MVKKSMKVILVFLVVLSFFLISNVQAVFASNHPSIDLEKTGIWYDNGTIIYKFTITNTGNAALKNISLHDDINDVSINWPNTDESWPSGTVYRLNVGQSIDVFGTYTPDSSINEVVNHATVKGLPWNKLDKPENYVSDDSTFPLIKTKPNTSLPEVPAGLLLGAGIAGIGGFILIKRRKASAAK